MAETIPIAADHAGFDMKERLIQELKQLGYEPLDLGTHSPEPVDYAGFAHQVAQRVARGDESRVRPQAPRVK